MVYAAEAGKLASVKWLHEHGCPGWDADLFATAVIYGSLKMLMWMHENGCPWDEEATELCCQGWPSGNTKVVARERLPDFR